MLFHQANNKVFSAIIVTEESASGRWMQTEDRFSRYPNSSVNGLPSSSRLYARPSLSVASRLSMPMA